MPMPKRFCLDCKQLFDATTGKSRCSVHQAALEARMNARPKPNTTKRGLGWQHQKRAKQEITQDMVAGGAVAQGIRPTPSPQTTACPDPKAAQTHHSDQRTDPATAEPEHSLDTAR